MPLLNSWGIWQSIASPSCCKDKSCYRHGSDFIMKNRKRPLYCSDRPSIDRPLSYISGFSSDSAALHLRKMACVSFIDSGRNSTLKRTIAPPVKVRLSDVQQKNLWWPLLSAYGATPFRHGVLCTYFLTFWAHLLEQNFQQLLYLLCLTCITYKLMNYSFFYTLPPPSDLLFRQPILYVSPHLQNASTRLRSGGPWEFL